MRIIFATILFLITNLSFSQSDSIVVQFEKNSSYLSLLEKSKLILKDDFTKVEIHAFCDYLGDEFYNLWLSNKRASRVSSYLIENGLNSELIQTTIGKGAINREEKSDLGFPSDRKAIVYIWKKEIAFEEEITIEKEPVEIIKQPTPSELLPDLDSIKVGESIKLPRLSFIPGQHNLSPGSAGSLNTIFEFLINNPKAVISIEGHICCETQYEDGYDQETGLYNLSTARAKVIYDYLISEGISSKRLSYKGFGRTRPLYPNESNTLEQQGNRRVEFKLLEK